MTHHVFGVNLHMVHWNNLLPFYEHLEREKLFPEEQKGCRRKSRGTKYQLIIDKMVIKDCKGREANLAIAWIDYKKAYDMLPHTWIMECPQFE